MISLESKVIIIYITYLRVILSILLLEELGKRLLRTVGLIFQAH